MPIFPTSVFERALAFISDGQGTGRAARGTAQVTEHDEHRQPRLLSHTVLCI